jgi:pimeloyl-ACP methyl ester carboxylesterase
MLAATPMELREVFETLLGEADRAVMTGELAGYLHAVTVRGLGKGVDGWVDDDLVFVAPWGFELGAITRPVLIVQGGDDRFVPKAHGEWLAAHVPGCEARIDDAHGHLTLFQNIVPEVHAWLLRHS